MNRIFCIGAAALVVLLLAACGGGDPEPDPVPSVNCAARPEVCL